MPKQDPIVQEVVVQLGSLTKTLEMHVVEHDRHITSIHDNMDTLDGAIIVASEDVRELQADLSHFAGIIGHLSNDFANVLRDIKKDVASRITALEHRLKHLGLRLNNTEHDYRVVSRQLEALSKQLEAVQAERQLERVRTQDLEVIRAERQPERAQMQDFETHLRAHVPGNFYTDSLFRELEVKTPAGDTAGLIKSWMKAAELQSEISSVNIKRVNESVYGLPGPPATCMVAPRILFSTPPPIFAPISLTRGLSTQVSSPYAPSLPSSGPSRSIPLHLRTNNNNNSA